MNQKRKNAFCYWLYNFFYLPRIKLKIDPSIANSASGL